MTAPTLKRLMALFEGCAGAHGTHGTPEKDPDGLKWNIKRTARTLRQPVTEDLWSQHLDGKRPLGIIPIRENDKCSWGSIDFDVYDIDLLEIVRRVEASKFPLVPCISKSGGLHLFLFLKEPEAAADMQTVLRDAAASLGMAKCEIFPKQQRVLTERNDLGNWMVMPYYGDTFNGKLRYQRGLKKTGAEMTASEFASYAEKNLTTIMDFAKLCEGRRLPSTKKNGKNKSKGDFTDGPPCLQHLTASGVQADGRKRTLFMMALYYKRAAPNEWKERLEQANQLFFQPPLPSEEVVGVIRSLEKKDYNYTCKEEPMKSYCDSTVCRMRKFGVGRGGAYPEISNLTKIDTEPPIWFADVEESRVELMTEDLQNYIRFHRKCMDIANKCYPVIRQEAWLSIVSEAMDSLILVEAPPDAKRTGRFDAILTEFLTNRSKGERFEDLWSGRPWYDETSERHYFTLRSLEKFMDQERFKEMTIIQVTRRIVALGGGAHYFNKRKPGIRTWWVPGETIEGPPEIDPPKIQEEKDI